MMQPTASSLRLQESDQSDGALVRRRAYTLIELMLSMAIMSILLVGIASSMLIASKALPTATSASRSLAEATAATDQIAAELALATSVTELTSTAITFTVADRGHGALGPETIRYAWSGTAGNPLTRQYNTAAPATIASNVTAFALTPTIAAAMLTSVPRVLMIVNNIAALSSDEQARSAKFATWGFPVTLVGSWDNQAIFDARMAACDVLYVTDECSSFTLNSRFNNPAVGIVTENLFLYAAVGMSSSVQTTDDKSFRVVDQTHEIMAGFVNNSLLSVCTASNIIPTQHNPNGTLAAGARVLAQTNANLNPALIVLDAGALQYDGVAARSRRVALPWGGQLFNPFNFSDLASDSRTILKRSLVWAAAPSVYDRISVRLAAGTAPASTLEVELLNQPRVPLR